MLPPPFLDLRIALGAIASDGSLQAFGEQLGATELRSSVVILSISDCINGSSGVRKQRRRTKTAYEYNPINGLYVSGQAIGCNGLCAPQLEVANDEIVVG